MKDLEIIFLEGRYHETLAQTVDSGRAWNKSHTPWVIGALSFTGRIDEARTLAFKNQRELKRSELIQTRFFLALGLIRISAYSEARQELALNIRTLRAKLTDRETFFVYQGLAFYRYFCGRLELALSSTLKALEAATKADFIYGKILASDIRGHVLLQTENVDEGLKYLGEALKLAKLHNNQALVNATEISILSYEAQYGIESKKIIEKLKRKLKKLNTDDTYSKATLLLELARQLILRANPKAVAPILDEASRLIYTFKNRRQEALLNIRWASLSFMQGEPYRALSFAQSALRSLDLNVDKSLELMALGMQLKIVKRLSLPDREIELFDEIERKSRHTSGQMHRRILHRLDPERFSLPQSKGDRIGSLIDRLNPSEGLEKVIDSELYSLIPTALDIQPSGRQLIFDAHPDSVIVIDHGQITIAENLTPLMRKVLEALAINRGAKHELIQDLWGYQYNPLRHDSLIYTNIVALRKALGANASWLETTESGYRLMGGVKLVSFAPQKPILLPTESVISSQKLGLNHRQLKFIRGLKSGEFVHVKNYQKQFKISEITACRDLAMLSQQGYVLRVGRARATRYVLV
jgi:hypothetical protein